MSATLRKNERLSEKAAASCLSEKQQAGKSEAKKGTNGRKGVESIICQLFNKCRNACPTRVNGVPQGILSMVRDVEFRIRNRSNLLQNYGKIPFRRL